MLKRFYIILMRLIFAAMLLISPPLAFSQTTGPEALASVQHYFDTGDYEKARALGAEIGTSEGYLLASEALTAKIILGHFDKPNSPAIEARELVEKAIELDPDNLDARFHYAVAFGLETQSTGVLKAWRKKMPTRMRADIEALRELAPNDPRGAALLGAWHLGIVNKVGKRNAYSWYKANADEGAQYFETALGLDNSDIVITSNYAASTALLGEREKAKELLTSIASLTPKHAAEQAIQARMATILSLYEDPKAFKRSAKRYLANKAP